MQDAPERMNKSATCTEIDGILTSRNLDLFRRQLLTLAKVHGQSSDYYRAALMPVIRKAMARLEARS